MQKNRIKYIVISCVLIFIGRAYQGFFWDYPLRAFFWDQSLLEPYVNAILNIDWEEFVGSLYYDEKINQLKTVFTSVLFIGGIASFPFFYRKTKLAKRIIFVGGLILIVLSLLMTKDKFYHFAMFFEHTIQFGTPFILLWFLKYKDDTKLLLFLKIAIALTFICHGIYALGKVYPLQANFITMTINILPINEQQAINLLFIAAIIDFIVAIGIFIPRITKICLLYCFIWGILTALARIVANFSFDFPLQTLHQNLYTVLYRIPHGLIPLQAYYLIKNSQSIK